MTIQRLTQELGVSRQTIYNWMAKGLPYKKNFVENTLRFRLDFDLKEVKQWIKERR